VGKQGESGAGPGGNEAPNRSKGGLKRRGKSLPGESSAANGEDGQENALEDQSLAKQRGQKVSRKKMDIALYKQGVHHEIGGKSRTRQGKKKGATVKNGKVRDITFGGKNNCPKLGTPSCRTMTK